MIRSVIFDIDGVLLDSFEANLKFFNDLLRHDGQSPLTRERYSTMTRERKRGRVPFRKPDNFLVVLSEAR